MKNFNRKRVLFLVNDDQFFYSHRLPLAIAVQKAGAAVTVAVPPGERRKDIEDAGFDFIPVRFYRGSLNPFNELRSFRDIWNAYRSVRPHLVHQVTLKPILYGSLAARITNIPAVVNAVTGLGYVFTAGGLRRRILRRIAEAAYSLALGTRNSCAIFQNPDDRGQFVNRRLVSESASAVIFGSGVDPAKFTPSPDPDSEVAILLPSRMLWDKGVGELIEAARALKREGVQFTVKLAGNPDPANPASIESAQLRAWQEEGIADWLGYRSDMPELYAQCHIVCLPSYYREGVPMSLIEAAACGRPIVTTEVPGCREIVRDGENGFLVPPRDSLRLAAALKKLIMNSALRRQMGKSGRKRSLELFSIETVVDSTFSIYETLLRDGSGGA